MGKYVPYFQDNVILPIPEISEALDPRIISLVVVDIKTRRFAGLKKNTSEEVMRTAGIPGQYFSRRSFATWDVLQLTKEQAVKLDESCISTKSFWNKWFPEICNVPINFPGEVVASYLIAFGRVEEMV